MNIETENDNNTLSFETPEADFAEPDAQGEAMQDDFGGALDGIQNKAMKRNALAMLIIGIVGFASVFFFAIRNGKHEPTAKQQAADAQLELALAKVLVSQDPQATDAASTADMLIQAFYDYPTKQQLSLSELKRDPFRLTEAVVSQNSLMQNETKRRLATIDKLAKAVKKLKLESILIGPQQSACMINGEVFREGASIDRDFRVKSISGNSVLLAAEYSDFMLEM